VVLINYDDSNTSIKYQIRLSSYQHNHVSVKALKPHIKEKVFSLLSKGMKDYKQIKKMLNLGNNELTNKQYYWLVKHHKNLNTDN
jgi:hypothetical protein